MSEADNERDIERLEDTPRRRRFSVVVQLNDAYEMGRTPASYLRTDTTTFESFYLAGSANAAALGTTAFAADILHAIPVVFPPGLRIEEVACEVTTDAVGATIRMGLYDATDEAKGNPYPNRLVFDSGELSGASTGVKGKDVEFDYVPGRLYFAVYVVGTSAPTIRAPIRGSMYPFNGMGAAFGANPGYGYTVTFTYAALPDHFPTGAISATAANAPGIGFRFARGSASEFTRTYVAYACPEDGEILRRARFIPSDGGALLRDPFDDRATEQSDNAWVYVRAGRRSGRFQQEDFGSFDSRVHSCPPWEPFALTGHADINVTLAKDQILDVLTVQGGWPPPSLRGAAVQFDLEGAA